MITVKFPRAQFDQFGSETAAGIALLSRLRAAGIPVAGRIMVQTVEFGKLSTWREGDEIIYFWEPY